MLLPPVAAKLLRSLRAPVHLVPVGPTARVAARHTDSHRRLVAHEACQLTEDAPNVDRRGTETLTIAAGRRPSRIAATFCAARISSS